MTDADSDSSFYLRPDLQIRRPLMLSEEDQPEKLVDSSFNIKLLPHVLMFT